MTISPCAMLRILLLPGASFGMALAETATNLGRPMRQGGAASTLRELECKGYVEFEQREPTGYQGHPRIYYRLTPSGRALAKKELKSLEQLVAFARCEV